jgi:hypothetical protein
MEQTAYQYPIYGSQTVIPYLASHLQSPAYVIEIREGEHGREHWLSSNFIDTIMETGDTSGFPQSLIAVFKEIDVNFDKETGERKAGICVDGLLAILSGIAKAKYGEAPISRIVVDNPFEPQKSSMIRTIQGKIIRKTTRTIPVRVSLTLAEDALEDADKQNPTAKQMWDLAMSNEYIARAFYYYSKANEDVRKYLQKVREEIEKDITYNKLKQMVGGEAVLEAQRQWINNSRIGGDKARHAGAVAQKTHLLPGDPCPIDFQDLIQQWISAK